LLPAAFCVGSTLFRPDARATDSPVLTKRFQVLPLAALLMNPIGANLLPSHPIPGLSADIDEHLSQRIESGSSLFVCVT